MRTFLLFSVLPLLCEATVEVFRDYVFVNQNLKWHEAREHCKQNYMDLAKITTTEEQLRVTLKGQNGWIGLKRSQNSNTWKWSDEEQSNFVNWAATEPDNSGNKDCVEMTTAGWKTCNCDTQQPFFCQIMTIFVKENKTWDEALEYCTMNDTSLASLYPLLMTRAEIQTSTMWIGLRFLDGQWFWLDRQHVTLTVPTPSCPAQPYHCGAHSSDKVWENRDCNEKLYFLCA